MYQFIQNHLQTNVNYSAVHSVCTHIMGYHSVYSAVHTVVFTVQYIP